MESTGTPPRAVVFNTDSDTTTTTSTNISTNLDALSNHWSCKSDVDTASLARHVSSMESLPSCADGLSRHPSGAAMAKKASGAAGMLFRKKSSAGRLFASGELGEANFNRDNLRSPNMREAILLKQTSEKVADDNEPDADIRIFDSKEEADRMTDLVLAFVTMPALEYAKGVHGMNGMIVLHNAIRVEIENIVTMICSVLRLGIDLTVGDVVAFQNWWLTSVEILHDYIEIETRVILPWIRKKEAEAAKDSPDNATSNVEITKIPVSQSEVRKLLDAVSRGFNRSVTGSPLAITALSGGSTFSSSTNPDDPNANKGGGRRERLTVDLIVAFDRCITTLITHMAVQETVKSDDADKGDYEELMGEIVDEILRSANQPDILLVFLGRWMVDPKMRKEYEKLIGEKQEHSYSKLQSQYEITHGATVTVFKVKAGLQ